MVALVVALIVALMANEATARLYKPYKRSMASETEVQREAAPLLEAREAAPEAAEAEVTEDLELKGLGVRLSTIRDIVRKTVAKDPQGDTQNG